MSKIYFVAVLCGVVFCATSSFAQLSANPWVNANTKEQVEQVYEKHQRRGYKATDMEYVGDSTVIIEKTKEHIEELKKQEEPTFVEKITAGLGAKAKENVEAKVEEKVLEEVASEESSAPTQSLDLGAKVDSVKNSFKLPKVNVNGMIRKFEQSIGVDFKAMAKKFK